MVAYKTTVSLFSDGFLCKDVTHLEMTKSRKVNDPIDSRDRNILIECQYYCLPCNIFPFFRVLLKERSRIGAFLVTVNESRWFPG